jgi:GTPase SAR1 family protein/uncharacterized protein YoxC
MNHNNSYVTFENNRQKLINLLSRSEAAFKRLDQKTLAESIKKLEDKLSSEHFKIMIVGEFKRGKSTFINALLGEEILPAYVIPCTAVINEVKWGAQKKAILYFRDPLPERLPKTISRVALDHIRKFKEQPVGPLEIPVQDLEEYAVIPDPAKDQAESVAESPFEKIELFWPLDLLHNGVEIIDSPGLNEHGIRTKITTEYLSSVDAVLFILSCDVLASQSELGVIEANIRAAGHEYIFFICNRFDLVPERERERLKSFGRSKLGGKTEFGPEGVYFISARDALDGRLNHDTALFERSGLSPLEKALTNFLTNDRGKVKLLQPARELSHHMHELLSQIIPAQRHMLDQTLEILEHKVQQVKPQLDEAERKQQQIIQKINNFRERLKSEIRREAENKLRMVVDLIPGWIQGLETQNKIKMLSFQHKQQAEALVGEIVEKINELTADEMDEWRKNSLTPLVHDRITEATSEIETQIDRFYTEIDAIKMTLTGINKPEISNASGLERVVAAAGGLLIAGPGAGLIGATMGFKEMAKSIVPQVALGVALLMAGITNPVILVAALFTGGFINGIIKIGKLNDEVKRKISDQITTKMREDLYPTSERIAGEIYNKTAELAEMVTEKLTVEINSVREQVESVLKDKRAGESQVQQKKAALNSLETELHDIDNGLMDLIFAVAGRTN